MARRKTRYERSDAALREFIAGPDYPGKDDDMESLSLPAGHKRATRLVRTPSGKLEIEAPWLLSDLFGV